MFWRRKPKSLQELLQDKKVAAVIERQRHQCVREIAEKWEYFRSALKFKPMVSLSMEITLFKSPIMEFVSKRYPGVYLKEQGIDQLVIEGIRRSGQPSPAAIEAAIEDMESGPFRRP